MNRKLVINRLSEARIELEKIKVSSGGIELMTSKALNCPIKLTNVRLGAANILKQEMLSLGGDAAVARGIVNGKEEISDVILLGTRDKIKKLIKKLRAQEIFGLKQIREDLTKLLELETIRYSKSLFCNYKELKLNSVIVMGILNITPDSFSDGSKFNTLDAATLQAKKMINAGAKIIDIGGESTRPGSAAVNLEEELSRVIPIIKAIRKTSDVIISIDTNKAEVARQAIEAGADIINDISALRFDKKMVKLLKDNPQIPIIMMHMRGKPKDMQIAPQYTDTIEEILEFFKERIEFCASNGISQDRIIIDPGIGFGKRQQDNLIILKRLEEFHALNCPILLGTSRKSFINKIYPATSAERLEGTLATAALAHNAGVHILRVHDVDEHMKFLKVLNSVQQISGKQISGKQISGKQICGKQICGQNMSAQESSERQVMENTE